MSVAWMNNEPTILMQIVHLWHTADENIHKLASHANKENSFGYSSSMHAHVAVSNQVKSCAAAAMPPAALKTTMVDG